jgi:cysteine desulfurase
MAAYLDHAASTPMWPEAVDAMLPHLRGDHGNPSGVHAPARAARKAIDEARDVIAEVLGAEPREVVFTSGGTESDNLAVLGVHDRVGGVVACSAIEHHAVLDPVESRKGRRLPVDGRGVLDLDGLVGVLDEVRATAERVSLVSVMLVNNEVGSIQPLERVARLVREHAPDAVVHTDAVQAVPWIDVAGPAAGADLVSISAHKFGGPKGAGALIVREGAAGRLSPRLIGGGQERERRPGTPAVAAIVGMATALRLTAAARTGTVRRVAAQRDRLADGLVASVRDLVETGVPVRHKSGASGPKERAHKVAGACPVCIEGVESESLLYLLDRAGVWASAGSSCASGAMETSHVLAAMGVSHRRAGGALRLSLGATTTDAEVDEALAAVPPAVARLREHDDGSPGLIR